MKNIIFKCCRVAGILLVILCLSAVASYAADADAAIPPPSDRTMNHQIHSAIVGDESLPYCAHMVRVQCREGKVTLKGKVKTKAQKKRVVEKATAIAGEKNVVSQIRVTGS